MLDVVGELVLVLRVEAQHVDEARHVDALEVTVSQSLHVTAGLDDHVVGDVATTYVTTPVAAVLQVHVYVASD